MCDECNTVNTIEHYLFACILVNTFELDIEQWQNEKSACPVVLIKKHVIFGLYYDLTHFYAINYVILLRKNVHLQTNN